jgi:hypothetical protein
MVLRVNGRTATPILEATVQEIGTSVAGRFRISDFGFRNLCNPQSAIRNPQSLQRRRRSSSTPTAPTATTTRRWRWTLAGGRPEIVHINQLLAGERRLLDYGMLVIAGGFSYGDDLGAGVLWAVDLQRAVAGGDVGVCGKRPSRPGHLQRLPGPRQSRATSIARSMVNPQPQCHADLQPIGAF